MLKEVAYFSSVYFIEENNINAPMMRYNMLKNHLIATYSFLHQGAQLLVVARATIPHTPFVARPPPPRRYRTCHLGVLSPPPLATVTVLPCDLRRQEVSDKPAAQPRSLNSLPALPQLLLLALDVVRARHWCPPCRAPIKGDPMPLIHPVLSPLSTGKPPAVSPLFRPPPLDMGSPPLLHCAKVPEHHLALELL
jgi:hypothetical protein